VHKRHSDPDIINMKTLLNVLKLKRGPSESSARTPSLNQEAEPRTAPDEVFRQIWQTVPPEIQNSIVGQMNSMDLQAFSRANRDHYERTKVERGRDLDKRQAIAELLERNLFSISYRAAQDTITFSAAGRADYTTDLFAIFQRIIPDIKKYDHDYQVDALIQLTPYTIDDAAGDARKYWIESIEGLPPEFRVSAIAGVAKATDSKIQSMMPWGEETPWGSIMRVNAVQRLLELAAKLPTERQVSLVGPLARLSAVDAAAMEFEALIGMVDGFSPEQQTKALPAMFGAIWEKLPFGFKPGHERYILGSTERALEFQRRFGAGLDGKGLLWKRVRKLEDRLRAAALTELVSTRRRTGTDDDPMFNSIEKLIRELPPDYQGAPLAQRLLLCTREDLERIVRHVATKLPVPSQRALLEQAREMCVVKDGYWDYWGPGLRKSIDKALGKLPTAT
jgi:hypothetical protein